MEFVRTLDDDGAEEEEEEIDQPLMNKNFSFSFEDTPLKPWEFSKLRPFMHPLGDNQTSVDSKIASRKTHIEKETVEGKRQRKPLVASSSLSTNEVSALPGDTMKPLVESNETSSFFEHAKINNNASTLFSDFCLDRRLQRAVSELGYTKPTPVQAAVIPVALLGRDICANAITGSGKTAAFMLPVLHRLLTNPQQSRGIRCLVLAPTRELAAQCMSMTQALARNTPLTVVLCVGGLSEKMQAAELRKCPDVVVATPGRLIDHLRNSQSVHLSDLQVLVLDEADRLLEQGFMAEVHEILNFVPKTRQTLLLSATMNTNVEELVALTLQKPMRVSVSAVYQLADHLTQEFVRVRAHREATDKEAMLLSICHRVYKTKTIIFCASKKSAHRMKIIFGLLDLKASELHGNMTQAARLDALEAFRDGTTDFLLATDLAARGLDIIGVQTVINFDMPKTLTQYIHRVGRTARAGRSGRSVSFVGDGPERAMLKELLKTARTKCLSRSVAPEAVDTWRARIEELEGDIKAIWRDELSEKELRLAEMEQAKASNILEFGDEMRSRPSKTWFQSAKEKKRNRTLGPGGTNEPAPKEPEKKKQKKDQPKTNKAKKKLALKKEREEMVAEIGRQRSQKRGLGGGGGHKGRGSVDAATAEGIRQQLAAARASKRPRSASSDRSPAPKAPAAKRQRVSSDRIAPSAERNKPKVPRPSFKSKSRYKRR